MLLIPCHYNGVLGFVGYTDMGPINYHIITKDGYFTEKKLRVCNWTSFRVLWAVFKLTIPNPDPESLQMHCQGKAVCSSWMG